MGGADAFERDAVLLRQIADALQFVDRGIDAVAVRYPDSRDVVDAVARQILQMSIVGGRALAAQAASARAWWAQQEWEEEPLLQERRLTWIEKTFGDSLKPPTYTFRRSPRSPVR